MAAFVNSHYSGEDFPPPAKFVMYGADVSVLVTVHVFLILSRSHQQCLMINSEDTTHRQHLSKNQHHHRVSHHFLDELLHLQTWQLQ